MAIGSDWPPFKPGETGEQYRLRISGKQLAAIQRAARPAAVVDVRQSEEDLQAAILEALAYAGVTRFALVIHIPNQGKRSPIYGAKLKAMGLLPGAADLLIVSPRGAAHFMEVKTDAGMLSRAQKEFRGSCAALGIPWAIVRTPEEALRTATQWGLVPKAKGMTHG